MARKKLICGNWKLHKTLEEAASFARALRRDLQPDPEVEVALAPPFTAIATVARELAGSTISTAAQDCYWEERGAFTGEISPGLLRDAGCRFAIVGHSERRALFGETDEQVGRKTRAALAGGLEPIVCVGETLPEREAGETLARIRKQIDGALSGLTPPDLQRIVIAYEPVWAIGTGRTASPAQAQEVHAFIRDRLRAGLGAAFGDVAERLRILYGGSVKPDGVAEIMAQADVDGALVGGASLEVESFLAIVRYKRP